MKLDNRFSIKTDTNNFILVELRDTLKKVEGKMVLCKTEHYRYYGTLYQALTGFLHHSVGTVTEITDVLKKASVIVDTIQIMEEQIKKEYCIEVLHHIVTYK